MPGQNDVWVVVEVGSHLVVGGPGEAMGVWPLAGPEAVPPTGQFVVAVHLLFLSESESGVKVHGQTLT